MKRELSEPTLADIIAALRPIIRFGVGGMELPPDSPLLRLPVVAARTASLSSQASRTYNFGMILQEVCTKRLSGKDADVAATLFGIGQHAGLPMQDRFRLTAQTYHPYWTWENFRKEPLTRLLQVVANALLREADLAPVQLNLAAAVNGYSGTLGQDWVMEHYESTYRFPSEAAPWLDVIQRRRFRSLHSGVTFWQDYMMMRERGTAPAQLFEYFGPGSLNITNSYRDSNGIWTFVSRVTFGRAYDCGETVEFSLRRHMAVDYHSFIPASGLDWYGLLIRTAPTDYVQINLQFSDLRPRVVWREVGIVNGLVQSSQPTAESLLAIDGTGYVSCAWQNLAIGLSYGVSIDWGTG